MFVCVWLKSSALIWYVYSSHERIFRFINIDLVELHASHIVTKCRLFENKLDRYTFSGKSVLIVSASRNTD